MGRWAWTAYLVGGAAAGGIIAVVIVATTDIWRFGDGTLSRSLGGIGVIVGACLSAVIATSIERRHDRSRS